MKLNYPSISQFQQFVELKTTGRPPKKNTSAMSASWPSTSSATRPRSPKTNASLNQLGLVLSSSRGEAEDTP